MSKLRVRTVIISDVHLGTAESKGTLLFTLPDAVRRAGVHEAPFGVTYRQLIEQIGGGGLS